MVTTQHVVVVPVAPWYSSWITPRQDIIDPNERREARAFLLMMLALLASGVLFVGLDLTLFILGSASDDPLRLVLGLFALAALALAYALSLRGRLYPGAVLLVTIILAGSWVLVWARPEQIHDWAGHTLLLNAIMAVVFFRPRHLVMVHALNLSFLVVLAALHAQHAAAWAVSMGVYVVGAAALSVRRVLTDWSLRDLDTFTAEWNAVLSSTEAAIVSLDRDYRVRSHNGAAQRLAALAGFPLLEVGQRVLDFVPASVQQRLAAIVEPAFAGTIVQDRCEFSTGGHKIQLETEVHPMRSRDGRIVGAAALLHDVTAREANRARVERRVAATQLAVLNAASHELNTPLTPLVIQMSLLRKERLGPLTPLQRHSLDTMNRSVRQLQRNVDAFLQATRMEQDLTWVDRDRVDLAGLVRHWSATRDSGRRVRLRLGEESAEVSGDRRLLQAALQHAVSVVLRWNQSGRPAIDLDVEGADVVLQVADSSSSVREPDLESIRRLLRDPSGMGGDVSLLPLHVCRRIVQAHGGAVDAGLDASAGFYVQVQLPLAPAMHDDEESPASLPETSSVLHANGARERREPFVTSGT